ncbi:MAG: MFS transporter [Microcella sp.]
MRQFAALYIVVAIAFASQQALNPVLAPLAREISLPEWQIGLVISSAAVVVVLTSVAWGRAASSRGPRRVLVPAFAAATTAMAVFAIAAIAALAGALSPEAAFVVFLLFRGLLFGAALAAVGPTVQAVIAARTPPGAARVEAIAGIGAAQGSSIVLGAAAGAALGALDVRAPLIVIPVLLLVGMFLAVRTIPARQEGVDQIPAARVSVGDARVRDFLIAGFLLYSALGFVQLLIGFLVVDRFLLTPSAATAFTGLALVSAGIGVILAQAALVPRLDWPPRRLMIVGSAIAAASVLCLALVLPLWLTVGVVGVVGLGIGLAAPGFTAGATLRASAHEQGAIAGLTGAVIASSFIVAPTLSTAIYALNPIASFLVAAVLLIAVTVLAALSPSIRATSQGFG